MKNFLHLFLLIGVILVGTVTLNGQSQFVNPGFEDWEEIGFGPDIIEPVNWSSIKSTDDSELNVTAPVVWGRCDDAHSGNYSLYLFTKSLFGLKVPGTITNGRIHSSLEPDSGYTYTDLNDAAWHTKLVSKPDSLVGWYKANPMEGDYAKVKVVVHKDFIKVSESQDTTKFIGSGTLYLSGEPVTEWKRFSLPLHYYSSEDPEFILVTLSSSKGTDAIQGSELWLDDLKLIYNDGSGIVEKNPGNLNLYASGNRLNVLVTGEKNQEYLLRVYDMSGRLQMEKRGRINQKSSYNYNLNPGIYIISISYDDKVLTQKIDL
jgi:hypothetical protein